MMRWTCRACGDSLPRGLQATSSLSLTILELIGTSRNIRYFLSHFHLFIFSSSSSSSSYTQFFLFSWLISLYKRWEIPCVSTIQSHTHQSALQPYLPLLFRIQVFIGTLPSSSRYTLLLLLQISFSFIMYFNNSTKGSILPNIQVGYMVSDLAQQNSGFLIANNTLRNHRYFSFASTLFLYLFIYYSFSNIYLLKSSWYADKSIEWVGRR